MPGRKRAATDGDGDGDAELPPRSLRGVRSRAPAEESRELEAGIEEAAAAAARPRAARARGTESGVAPASGRLIGGVSSAPSSPTAGRRAARAPGPLDSIKMLGGARLEASPGSPPASPPCVRGPSTAEWAAVSSECGWPSPSDCVAHKVSFPARTDAKVRAEGLGKHVQRLRAAANEFKARGAEARERCEALSGALREAESRLSRAENALEASTREAERTRREAATLAARLEASQEAVRELRAASAAAEERCSRAEAAEREATARAERESAYVGELHAYNARLQEESARARREADRGAVALLEAREAAAEARGRLEAAEAARAMAEREASSIEEAVDAARARAASAERLAGELRAERDAAAAEAEAAREELSRARTAATSAKVEAEAMASADARIGAALREEVPRLREERERALKELADVKKSRDEARRKARELEKLLAAERDAAAVAERHRRALHEAVLDLKGKVRVFCRVRPMRGQVGGAADDRAAAAERSEAEPASVGPLPADDASSADSDAPSDASSASDDENRSNRSGSTSARSGAGRAARGRAASTKAAPKAIAKAPARRGARTPAPSGASPYEDPLFASRDASALVTTGAMSTPASRAPLGVRERVEVFGGGAPGVGLAAAGSAPAAGTSRHVFEFDRVFGPSSSQDDVYAELGPVVQSALDGYRVAVLAYGQTGSGKTHTMLGAERDPGVIPRAAEHVRAAAERLKRRGWGVDVRVRALEVINDDLVDLLEGDWPGRDENKVEVSGAGAGGAGRVARGGAAAAAAARDPAPLKPTLTLDARGEATVRNATVVDASGGDDLQAVLAVARSRRASASTLMNASSSRSHLVFTLWIDARDPDSGRVTEGQLCLVDLAGSERLQRSGATGDRARESAAINKSLSTLGDVLAALAAKAPHVPYRNSKLTHLLSSVLAAESSKVAMLVACAPEPDSAAETLCALRFAAKVNATELGAARPQTGGGGSAAAAAGAATAAGGAAASKVTRTGSTGAVAAAAALGRRSVRARAA